MKQAALGTKNHIHSTGLLDSRDCDQAFYNRQCGFSRLSYWPPFKMIKKFIQALLYSTCILLL